LFVRIFSSVFVMFASQNIYQSVVKACIEGFGSSAAAASAVVPATES
jgi:hypothetical protein